MVWGTVLYMNVSFSLNKSPKRKVIETRERRPGGTELLDWDFMAAMWLTGI